MRLTAKDGAATVATALAVLTFAATHEGWNVWLVGSSHRWAAAVIGVLGMVACSLGERVQGGAQRFFAVLGTVTLALAVWAIASGSLTPLSLLVVAVVVLWLGATLRHAAGPPRHAPQM